MFGLRRTQGASAIGPYVEDEQRTRLPVVEEEMIGLLGTVRAALPPSRRCAIGIISTHPGEGVSSVAQGLAQAAARNPRTEVLLCAVRGETRSKRQAAPFIFLETVAGRSGERLAVGEVGGPMLAEAVATNSNSGSAIVRSMTASFDLAFIELPPASKSTVGPSLSRALDGVVLVVEAERTRAHAVRATRKSIEMCGGNIIGVVLNKRRYHIPSFIYRRL